MQVTAERSGKWWVLECPAAGVVSQVRSLAGADFEMREAIAYQLGVNMDSFRIDLQIVPPAGFVEVMERANRLAAESSQAERAAAAARIEAAKYLAAQHLSVRDIGRVMGISFQRAHQLVSSQPL